MALIPPFFLDTVVAIGTLNNQNETVWIGTGFLYGYLVTPPQDPKQYRVYLITNKHVIQTQNIIILRFNPQTDQAATDFREGLNDQDGNPTWTSHPDPNVDVAVLNINTEVLDQQGLIYNFFTSDEHCMNIQNMQENGITEGDFLFTLGFPMGLVSKDRKNVILRQGVIARIRDLFEKRNKDFIIDASVFPGNSGGPVILKPEMVSIEGTVAYTKASLIGLVKSYISFQDVAISQQTGKPRIIFEENSGLSMVEPVDHITETIAEDFRKKNIT